MTSLIDLPRLRSATAVAALAFGALAACSSNASAGSLTRTTNVAASADEVWSAIGPFCAIKDWHPMIATCDTDAKVPPTRTLVTKDGKATFVETEIARDDAKRLYSYNFVSSPLPVPKYLATIRVVPHGAHASTIIWHGDFVAAPGKASGVKTTLANIYETGLKAIKAKFEK